MPSFSTFEVTSAETDSDGLLTFFFLFEVFLQQDLFFKASFILRMESKDSMTKWTSEYWQVIPMKNHPQSLLV